MASAGWNWRGSGKTRTSVQRKYFHQKTWRSSRDDVVRHREAGLGDVAWVRWVPSTVYVTIITIA